MKILQQSGFIFTIFACTSITAGQSEECQIEDESKKDCGYYGISAEDCKILGCCYEESTTDDVGWCYFNTLAYQCASCDACPWTARTDCGNSETTQEQCEANKCLWCPVFFGPWCVVNTGLEISKECAVENKDKVDCGVFKTTNAECQERGCCWYPTASPGTPWCYNKTATA